MAREGHPQRAGHYIEARRLDAPAPALLDPPVGAAAPDLHGAGAMEDPGGTGRRSSRWIRPSTKCPHSGSVRSRNAIASRIIAKACRYSCRRDAPVPDTILTRAQDFLGVEVLDPHADGGLFLPAPLRVHAGEKQGLVALLRHPRRRRLDPLVRPPVERERPGPRPGAAPRARSASARPRADPRTRPRRAAAARTDPAPRRSRAASCRSPPARRSCPRRHAEDHRAAIAVEEGAKRLAGPVELAGRLFELQRRRLAAGDPSFNVFEPTSHFPRTRSLDEPPSGSANSRAHASYRRCAEPSRLHAG